MHLLFLSDVVYDLGLHSSDGNWCRKMFRIRILLFRTWEPINLCRPCSVERGVCKGGRGRGSPNGCIKNSLWKITINNIIVPGEAILSAENSEKPFWALPRTS